MTHPGPGTWQPQPHAGPPVGYGNPHHRYPQSPPPRDPWGPLQSGWGGPPGPPSGPPPAPYGWQPEAPKRSRLKWILPVVLVTVLVLGGLGIWGFLHYQSEQVKGEIRDTVNAFAEASDTADTKKLAALMCDEEAAQFLDGYEGQDDDGPIEPAERRPVNIGTVTVTDDDATVEVTRPPAATVTLKLTRVDGTWKMCNPA